MELPWLFFAFAMISPAPSTTVRFQTSSIVNDLQTLVSTYRRTGHRELAISWPVGPEPIKFSVHCSGDYATVKGAFTVKGVSSYITGTRLRFSSATSEFFLITGNSEGVPINNNMELLYDYDQSKGKTKKEPDQSLDYYSSSKLKENLDQFLLGEPIQKRVVNRVSSGRLVQSEDLPERLGQLETRSRGGLANLFRIGSLLSPIQKYIAQQDRVYTLSDLTGEEFPSNDVIVSVGNGKIIIIGAIRLITYADDQGGDSRMIGKTIDHPSLTYDPETETFFTSELKEMDFNSVMAFRPHYPNDSYYFDEPGLSDSDDDSSRDDFSVVGDDYQSTHPMFLQAR